MYPCWKFRSDPWSFFFESLAGRVPFRDPVECRRDGAFVDGLNRSMGMFASRSHGRSCWLLHPVAFNNMAGLRRTSLESKCDRCCIPVVVGAVITSTWFIEKINGETGGTETAKEMMISIFDTDGRRRTDSFWDHFSPPPLPPPSDATPATTVVTSLRTWQKEKLFVDCKIAFEVWFLVRFGFVFWFVSRKNERRRRKSYMSEWLKQMYDLLPLSILNSAHKNNSFLLLTLILAFQTTFCYASKTLRKNYIMNPATDMICSGEIWTFLSMFEQVGNDSN